jgi:glycosidase
MLQMFEARWSTLENRMADIFEVGYGRLWLPPPSRADSGNQSVGYDVYDRFDLGKPRNETLYGTETSLKTLVRSAHGAGVLVNTDFIANHDGFSDSSTVDNRGTPSNPADDVTFVQAGDYPGFVVTLPGDIDGDFHGAFEGGEENSRLSGLIDIAQEKNHQFIRHPVAAGNPQNIPAGTQGVFGRPPADVPDPNNARFYTDQGLGGTIVWDPRLMQNVTLYNFNTANPLEGDAVAENATGLLMRNARWMIQEIGVDGFRLDAARHFPRWVLNYLDQAMFLAKQETLLDGSPQHVFTFSETGYDEPDDLDDYVRKDINNTDLGQLGGNRDVLDFNLFGALKGNLTGDGFANNWHSIRGASIDTHDKPLNAPVWHRDGSQGVAFAQSHDELGPFLQNVAYAYILMMPGNALVYTNAKEFGDGRNFPRGGKVDALGGFYGETITTLVDIRNTHGRGNFHERWIDYDNGNAFSNIYVYERENSALVGLNSRVDIGYDQRTVSTGFAPDTVLVELSGNADDPAVDPSGVIYKTVRVNGSGQATIRIPRNKWLNTQNTPDPDDDVEEVHGRGYVVYGLAAPQGTLSLSNVAQVMQGATPSADNNGTARLADIDVITADSFTVQLDTIPVILPAPEGEMDLVRDVHADGDQAMIKIDRGLNINGTPGIDDVTPGSVGYGFENFTTIRTPGYIWSGGANIGTGSGTYAQTIDATQLAEGRHYVTARAFRHRDQPTGGDGGPAVFNDFKRTIYIDRLPPVAAIVSFDPFASSPNTQGDRDLIVRSVDKTADNMHFFLDLPANVTNAQIFQMTQQGQGDAGTYDRDSFVYGYFGVKTGNHVATVVTFEPTGNYNIQRFAGLFTDTNGLSPIRFGDMNGNGVYAPSDILCQGPCNNFSVEDVLYSQNNKFLAAFDVNGDGLGDNHDLFALGDELIDGGADGSVLTAYTNLLLKRGDFNANGTTNLVDVSLLYGQYESSPAPAPWLYDLNLDGDVDDDDVTTMITELFRTVPGDFNLDGAVDSSDYVLARKFLGATGALYTQGDADLDGDVDANDLAEWEENFGFLRQPLQPGAGGSPAVPEPSTFLLMASTAMILLTIKTQRARNSNASCMIQLRARPAL